MFDIEMESDLQHLIRISIDKMVNVESAHTPRRGNRKGGEIDLRKTLLVAHLIQEVRTAYLQDDCQIFENSISDTNESDCCREREENEAHHDYNKSWKREQFSHESNFFMDDESVVSHASNVQSCLTNSKSMVSRICQVTRPLCVSVNTNHVMTYHTTDEEKILSSQDDNSTSQDDEILCEELDVSSCCEVESTPEIVEEETTFSTTKPSSSTSTTTISSASLPPPPSSVETTEEETQVIKVPVNQQEDSSSCSLDKFHRNDVRHSPDAEEQSSVKKHTSSSVCLLPKKKRPLPKEFLEELAAEQPTSKHSKTSTNYQDTTTTVAVSTPATTSVTSQSWSTSTTVSTVCSTIGFTTHQQRAGDVNPKVVVQLTQSLDYTFPLTCTQILLHHHSVYDKLSRRALA